MLNIIAVILGVALSASCHKEEFVAGNIEMEFQFENLPVDLNIVDNPYITCVIRSETGLKSIQMFLESEDGTLTQYKDDITEFFNPTHYSIYERPVYKEGMAAFVVKAIDLGGSVKVGRVTFEIFSKVNPPVIRFNTDAISFAEGDPIPQFSFVVTSDADLESVSVELIQSAVSSDLVDMVVEFTDARNFEFDSAAYELNQYDFNRIPQLIRVVAVDAYGKISISTLKINYKALPAPVVSVNQPSTVTEFEDCVINGNATSETGITKVECYTLGENYECLAISQNVDGGNEYDIAMTIPGDEIRDYVTAIKVVVTDARNKKTENIIPVTVTPVFENISSTDNLVDEIAKRFSDEKYRTVKLLLPSGATYSIGTAVKLTKNLMLKSENGASLPVINVTSAYTFDTDNAHLDIISFENISFKTSKTGSFFMGNQAATASIGELSVKGCVLEGYTNSFYRSGDRVDMTSLYMENNIFYWANTNSNYSFLHFAKDSGSLGSFKVVNSTFTGVLFLHYNNLKNTEGYIEVSNCTFANSKASANAYFINIANTSLKGDVVLKKNLFGGSNNLTGNCRMLRANSMAKDVSENYCTVGWKTFVDDQTNNSVNFCTPLTADEDNDQLFKDYKNNDFTITPATTVYEYGIGDPRWIN